MKPKISGYRDNAAKDENCLRELNSVEHWHDSVLGIVVYVKKQ